MKETFFKKMYLNVDGWKKEMEISGDKAYYTIPCPTPSRQTKLYACGDPCRQKLYVFSDKNVFNTIRKQAYNDYNQNNYDSVVFWHYGNRKKCNDLRHQNHIVGAW